jgi:hypothetical protein
MLHEKMSRFITLERLIEIAHEMDTQVNESFNNTVSWLAPKNKVYCGSHSLTNRVSLTLGINLLGFDGYFKLLFKKMSIVMESNVLHFLQVKEKQRSKRLALIKTKEKKREGATQKYVTLKKDEEAAKLARTKRDEQYKSGIHMKDDDGAGSDDDDSGEPKKKKAKRDVLCPYCNLKGHTTKRSRQCLQYIAVAAPAAVPAAANNNNINNNATIPAAADAAIQLANNPAEDAALQEAMQEVQEEPTGDVQTLLVLNNNAAI